MKTCSLIIEQRMLNAWLIGRADRRNPIVACTNQVINFRKMALCKHIKKKWGAKTTDLFVQSCKWQTHNCIGGALLGNVFRQRKQQVLRRWLGWLERGLRQRSRFHKKVRLFRKASCNFGQSFTLGKTWELYQRSSLRLLTFRKLMCSHSSGLWPDGVGKTGNPSAAQIALHSWVEKKKATPAGPKSSFPYWPATRDWIPGSVRKSCTPWTSLIKRPFPGPPFCENTQEKWDKAWGVLRTWGSTKPAF